MGDDNPAGAAGASGAREAPEPAYALGLSPVGSPEPAYALCPFPLGSPEPAYALCPFPLGSPELRGVVDSVTWLLGRGAAVVGRVAAA